MITKLNHCKTTLEKKWCALPLNTQIFTTLDVQLISLGPKPINCNIYCSNSYILGIQFECINSIKLVEWGLIKPKWMAKKIPISIKRNLQEWLFPTTHKLFIMKYGRMFIYIHLCTYLYFFFFLIKIVGFGYIKLCPITACITSPNFWKQIIALVYIS
jgi:hypothetical protein